MTDELNTGVGLAIIRRRRWYFWLMVIIYLPSTWSTLEYTQSYRITGIVFAVWVVLLCISIVLLATAKCPSCGKAFYMRGASLSLYRTCRHCGLSSSAES